MSERDTALGSDQVPSITPLCVDAVGLAMMLNVSERTVHRLDDGGRIPAAISLGACKRWRIEEVEAWMRAGAPKRKEWLASRGSSS